MNEQVTIQAKSTLGADGRPTWATGVAVWSRVVDKSGVLRKDGGREYAYDRTVYLLPDVSISLGDRVTYGSATHEVVDVRVVKDIGGRADHIVARLRRIV